MQLKYKDLLPVFNERPQPMAKKKAVQKTKKTRRATVAEAKADGLVSVKFHQEAGLNLRYFKVGDLVDLTPQEYDTLHRSCTIVEEVKV